MAKVIEFVVPVYNEEGNIELLYKRLKAQRNFLANYDVRFLFINDGSKDKSQEMLEEIVKKDTKARVISFARNFGHQIAISAGMDYSVGDAVIIIDADLQDPPEVSQELIKEWEKGFEVVYAQRRSRQDGFFKKVTAFLFYRLLESLANIKIPKDTGDFRLMDRKVVEAIKKFREKNRYMRGLVSYVGFKQTAVLFDRHDRHAGETHYPLSKMVRLSLDAITSFSAIPLHLILQIGMIGVVVSMLGIFYVLYLRVFQPAITVSGWTSIMLVTLFLGSVQMIMLGIMGVYVGRIYSEVQARPLYIVSTVSDYGSTESS